MITAEERQFLDEVIRASKLTESQIKAMHESYLNSLVQAVTRDQHVSQEEHRLVAKIADVLGIHSFVPPALTSSPTAGPTKPGQRVCFTGTAVDADGVAIARSDLECLAASAGMQPVGSVSRKGCDLLVAADISSTSGKAKKAREYGVPILSVPQFLEAVR